MVKKQSSRFDKKIKRWRDIKTGHLIPYPIIYNVKLNRFEDRITKKIIKKLKRKTNKINKREWIQYLNSKISKKAEYLLPSAKKTKKYIEGYNKKLEKAKTRQPKPKEKEKLKKFVRSKLRYGIRLVRFHLGGDGNRLHQSPEIVSANDAKVLDGFHSINTLNDSMGYPLTTAVRQLRVYLKMPLEEGFSRWKIDYDYARFVQYSKTGKVYAFKSWSPISKSL